MFSLLATYAIPFALEWKLPSRERNAPLAALTLPSFSFPNVRVPDANAPAQRTSPRTAKSTPRTATRTRERTVTRSVPSSRPAARTTQRIPVVTSTYSLTPATKPASKKKDPFEKAPVVVDSTGGAPPPPNPDAAPAPPPPAAAVPVETAPEPVAPVVGGGASGSFQSAGEPTPLPESGADPAAAEAAAPVDETISSSDADAAPSVQPSATTSVASESPATIAPAPTTYTTVTVTYTTVVVEPEPQVQLDAGSVELDVETVTLETETELVTDDAIASVADPIASPVATVVASTEQTPVVVVPDPDPTAVSLGAPVATSSSSGGQASSTAAGDDAAIDDSGESSATPEGALLPATDPEAVPGSGRGPPEAWVATLSSDTAHVVSIGLDGDNLVLIVDGVVLTRALASVSSLTIVGGAQADAFTVGTSGGIAVTFDGGEGIDTLFGPADDSRWEIHGRGAGSVHGVAFDRFENLNGASGNKDTFVVAAEGSIAGAVEGGDGGYDTIVLSGGSFARTVSRITGPQSGRISRDADVLIYGGLEPVVVDAPTGTFTVELTSGDDVAVVKDQGTAADGSIVIDLSVGEDHVFTNVGSLAALIIRALAGNDHVTIHKLDVGFTATLTVEGGDGVDTIATSQIDEAPAVAQTGFERASVSFVRDHLQSVGATISGATVITHGFQLGNGDGDSLRPLALAIRNKVATGWLIDYDAPVEGEDGYIDLIGSNLPTAAGAGELIFLFDWAAESNEPSNGWGEGAADALLAILLTLGAVSLTSQPPLHLIAHSFGTGVTSELVERLDVLDVQVDHLTYLDPHDFNQGFFFDGRQRLFDNGQPDGYGASVWSNVVFAEAYYETTGRIGPIPGLVPEGRPIPGAYNYFLGANRLPSALALVNDHSWVWGGFYLATITGSLSADTDGDGDLDTIDNSIDGVDFTKGYAFSRVAGGAASRPAPVFYGASQDHEHSSALLVDRATGTPNAAGLARLGLTSSQIENGR